MEKDLVVKNDLVVETDLTCTCWDVNAGECEFHRLMELDGCDYDWDEEVDEVSERDIDVILSDADDELPF